MAKILKGAMVADALSENIRERAKALRERGIVPKLSIVRLGEDPSDLAYERGALKRGEKTAVDVEVVALPRDISTDQLLNKIEELNEDDSVHGILLFRPLPPHIEEEVVRNKISLLKDVDGISDGSMAGIYSGNRDVFSPCTARACIELLRSYEVSMKGKKVAVLGRSLVIGKPVSMLALDENSTVTICHSKSENIDEILKESDIVISAVGKIGAVTKSMVRAGQTIIDVGINVDSEGNLKGDVDFEDVSAIVDRISPVPAGVGSVTTSILMDHVVKSAQRSI